MIAAILSISILTVNFWHVISEWLNNPPGNFFVGIAHYYKDYFLYVSQMAEGMNGHILSYAPMYTNERLPETFVYWPNVLMGHIGGMFTSNPFVVYLAFLLLLCSILCLLLWILAKQLFPKNPTLQTTAFLILS